jgi:hypothetical protein
VTWQMIRYETMQTMSISHCNYTLTTLDCAM